MLPSFSTITMASTSDAALKAEIARLTGTLNTTMVAQLADEFSGAINQHKQRYRPSARSTQATHDVVIDGVTFETSSRSLVRKGRESPSSTYNRARLQPTPSSAQTPFNIHQGSPQADTPTNRFLKDNTWTPPTCPSSLQIKGLFSHPATPTKESQHDPQQHPSANTVCPLPQSVPWFQSDFLLQRPTTHQTHEISQQTMRPFYHNRCASSFSSPMFYP